MLGSLLPSRSITLLSPRVLLALVLASTIVLVHAPVAMAADNANCANPNAVFQFSGMQLHQNGLQKHGVSGTIDGQQLNMCTNPEPVTETSGSWAWSALGRANSGANTILQIGEGKCREFLNGQCDWDMDFYWAWGIDPSTSGCSGWQGKLPTPNRVLPNSWQANAYDYKIWHNNNQWQFYIGLGNPIKTLAEGDICWTPNLAWWFEETWDNGDALGGSAGNKLKTTEMNYANAEGGGFVYTNFNNSNACTFAPGNPRFCDIVNSTTMNTWTNR